MSSSTLSVTEKAATIDLTVLETVKADMGIESSGHDEVLSLYIRQASAAIATYCRRTFGAETLAETFYVKTSTKCLVLSRYPVISLSSVTRCGNVMPEDQYDLDAAAGLLYRRSGNNRTYWNWDRIVVNYVAGYQLVSGLPFDLERACIAAVKSMWASRNRDPLVKRVEIPDVRTVDYWVGGVGSNAALPPDVISLIEPFRDVRLR